MAKDDPFHLERFLEAQNPVFELVCAELRGGEKRSHWMWFIFPQLKGLGWSEMAARFAIASREEAAAYAAHPILGERLRECTRLVNLVTGRSVEQIFGYPDDLKFNSSMTLFAKTAANHQVFDEALQKYFDGTFDEATLQMREK
jgi:uncharacterized protein (DUF1810 family)